MQFAEFCTIVRLAGGEVKPSSPFSVIDDWKEVERYETAKPSKDLGGLYESQVRKSILFLFGFFCVRCVWELFCRRANASTPGQSPGACLMPPRPSRSFGYASFGFAQDRQDKQRRGKAGRELSTND